MAYIIIILFGVISSFSLLIIKAIRTISLLKNGIRSYGKIIDIIETKNSNNDIVYRPLIQICYKDKEMLLKPNVGTLHNNFEKGDNLKIIFHKDEMKFCKINKFIYIWGEIFVIALFAISMLIVLVYLINNNLGGPNTERIKLPYT